MMNTAQFKIYDIVRNEMHLSDEKALGFVEAVTEVAKEDKRQSATEYKSIFKEDILQLEIRIKDKLSDQFKWVIGVFVAIALMITGLYM